jgi:hypothetical protein
MRAVVHDQVIAGRTGAPLRTRTPDGGVIWAPGDGQSRTASRIDARSGKQLRTRVTLG